MVPEAEMIKEIDIPKVKTEMIEVYQKYLENPKDEQNMDRMNKLSDIYDGSEDYVPYDSATSKAVGYLFYLWLNSFNLDLDKEELMSKAKEILANLTKTE